MDAADIESAVARAYDRGAEGYQQAWPQPHPWLRDERDELTSRLKPGARILDVGCGLGHDTALFQSLGFSVTGVDVSSQMIALARDAYPQGDFRLLSALRIDELGESFDAIWLCYVLLHLPKQDMPRFIRALRSSLRPGGLAAFVTSVEQETRACETEIAGLTDRAHEHVTVYNVRWEKAELDALFDADFRPLWARVTAPLPGRPHAYSCLLEARA